MSAFAPTPSQAAAQSARGRTLVAAAAGSGKTTVLTNRIFNALTIDRVPPGRLVAVTFTNDAAQEIRSRVQQKLLEAGESELLELLSLATIGTIHSLCGRLVREHGTVIGVDPGVAILDEAQSNLLRKLAFDEACALCDDDADVVRLRTRITDEKLLKMLRRLRSRGGAMVNTDLQFPSRDGDEALCADLEPDVVMHGEIMSRLNERFLAGYLARCQVAGAVDFDDLQVMAYELLQNASVRTAVRARYTQVLVDEFQDTDTLQESILSLIGDRELFMVGDEWQSIYGFRGADVDVFRAVARNDDVAAVSMRENFRSSPGILAVINTAFGADHVFGERYEPVVAGTTEVELDEGLAGPAVTVLEAPRPGGPWPGDPTEEEIAAGAVAPPESHYRPEGELIAERIARLIEAGARPDDVAVIARSRTHMESLSLALGEWGIPALVSSAGSLFEDPDVVDVVALLSWVHRSIDDAAALTVLSSPFAGSSWQTIVDLRTRAGDEGSLWSAMHDSPDETLRDLAVFVSALRDHTRDGSIVGVVERAISHPRFAAAVLGRADGRLRLANVRRLIEYARDAHGIGATDLGSFLEFITAQHKGGSDREATLADASTGAVRVLTVHAAKGLEFPYVFVMDLGNQGRTEDTQVEIDASGRVLMPLVDDDGKLEHGVLGCAVEHAANENRVAELQRIMYVALTRAKRRLFITYTAVRVKKNGEPYANEVKLLGWVLPALGMDLPMVASSWRHPELDLEFERAPRPLPASPLTQGESPDDELVIPVPMPSVDSAATIATTPVDGAQREAARHRLRSALLAGEDDERARLDGIMLHAAAAELIDPALRGGIEVAGAGGHGRIIDRLAASGVLAAARAASAMAEVPFCSPDGGTGRIDAFAFRDDGSAWIIDWKTALPPTHAAAGELHGEQLQRYARAAASLPEQPHSVLVTLVPLTRVDQPLTWRYDPGTASLEPLPDFVP